ncbi:MAG: hypothetical protein IJV31_07960, partial [Clostridia bacterium]|nr:hypothetical protein [Clostridia bacterium]
NLIFYNDYEKYKEEIEKNKKENLEKYKKILEEKKAEEQEKQQEIIKKQKEQKQNAIIGMIINCLIIIIGWNTMPFGIITVLIGIIGFIICLALAL